jgi:predicted RNA-binding Zn ribbon-like protein
VSKDVGALALDLVNTFSLRRGRPIDGLGGKRDVEAWVERWQGRLAAARTGVPSVGEIRTLRSLLQTLFESVAAGRRPARDSIERLNRISASSRQHSELSWPPRGEPGVRLRAHARSPGGAILAAVARSAIELLGGSSRHLLERCSGPRCVRFFLTTDPRRTWCSDACGNRARMTRYRDRRRGQTP